MKRKEAVFKGLDLINVFFEDTSLNSPDVFQIIEFPTRLSGGKNLIKLKGHPDNLRIGSYLNIEVLDYNGDPIYHEIIDYIDEDKSRIIAIYVYEETSPGEAVVVITGELKQINGQLVPQEWEGKTNVRWSRTVQVNPLLSNNSEIIFETAPEVTLIEQIGVQLDRIYPNDIQYPTYTTGTVRYFSYNNQPAIEISNGIFTKDMEDGTITVPNPVNPLPTPQYTISNNTYTSTIKKVLNETTILLDSEFVVASSQSLSLHVYTSFDYSTYTLDYEATPTYVPTENSESFAFIDISGLQPATGDVNRVKILLNGAGSIGTWEQINDIELVAQELLIDTSSVYPDFKIGEFTSQSIIDNYWEAHYYSGFSESTAPTLTFITSSIGQGVQIVPLGGHNLTGYNQIYTFQTQDQYTATFVRQSSYKIIIDAIGTRSTISGNDNPKLSVFLSGSAFPYDATDILNQELPVKLGRRIGQIEVTSNSQRFDDEVFEFEAPATGIANLIFVVESGEWQLSDIRTTTDNDAGYTPGYARIRTEVPTKHKSNAQYAFRIEYYNVAGVKSRQTNTVSNVNWSGGNRYIDGEYSMLTGSLYVADSLESGIAISGYADTGFVRSLGYSGFEYGDPGFLLWSGSALEGSSGTKGGVPYSGVGLELYANENNYFRFSTTDSELDVRASKFFIGTPATQFISGSDGNVEISSSNFHLDSNGDVTITGRLNLANGTPVEDAINAVTESATARALSIGVDSQVFAFDNSADTTPTPDTIVFTISQQNLSEAITTSDVTITKTGGGTLTTPTLNGVVTDGSGQLSGSLSFSGESLLKSDLPLTIEVSKDSLLDTTTIFKVEGGTAGADGTDAVTAFLTNESHTFPADVNGTISSFAGGETDMIVFQGITDVTDNYTFSRVSTTSVSSSIVDNTVTITSMAHDSGSVNITATSASVSLSKTMSLAKSKQGNDGAAGADNQDFTWANENLLGVGPVAAGLLMTANVFGFHDGITGSNGSLDDFTSYLDSSGNFYLGSGSSDAQFVWDNTTQELLISGSNAKIEVDKFFVGTQTSQFISGSNGIIEISSSNFHLDSNGDVTMAGTITATAGTIGGFNISSTQINSSNNNLKLLNNGIISGSDVFIYRVNSGTVYPLVDTANGIIDARNNGRQVVTDTTENSYSGNSLVEQTLATYVFNILPYETKLGIFGNFQVYSGTTNSITWIYRAILETSNSGSGAFSSGTTYYDAWTNSNNITIIVGSNSGVNTNFSATLTPFNDSFHSIPTSHQGTLCRLRITAQRAAGTPSVSTTYRVKNLSVITTRELATVELDPYTPPLSP